MWRVAASRGSKNGCPWGCVGGGRRPSAHEGELGEYKWAWQAAGLEPWALQDPGSEIWPRESGHVWLLARAFTCAGDRLVHDVHLRVSRAQPWGAAWWGRSCARGAGDGEAAPPALSPGHMWRPAAAAPPGTLPTLTGGLSFPCLEAAAFPELKYFERT